MTECVHVVCRSLSCPADYALAAIIADYHPTDSIFAHPAINVPPDMLTDKVKKRGLYKAVADRKNDMRDKAIAVWTSNDKSPLYCCPPREKEIKTEEKKRLIPNLDVWKAEVPSWAIDVRGVIMVVHVPVVLTCWSGVQLPGTAALAELSDDEVSAVNMIWGLGTSPSFTRKFNIHANDSRVYLRQMQTAMYHAWKVSYFSGQGTFWKCAVTVLCCLRRC
jgi:hypothetical protein